MSTSEADGLAHLRRKAFAFLPGTQFDDMLAEVRRYHQDHPPNELLGGTRVKRGDGEQVQLDQEVHSLIDQTHDATRAKLVREHRDMLVAIYTKSHVPPPLAEEIVDALVLGA